MKLKCRYIAIAAIISILIGTFSMSHASTASLIGTVDSKTLTFNTSELPENATITSATLNLTGSDTTNGVELFEIRVLANGQIAGSLNSDEWQNDTENIIELNATKINTFNNQITLQIASSLEVEDSDYVAELLPATATLSVSYEQGGTIRNGEPRIASTVSPAIAVGAYYTVCLKADGTVWGWGRNDTGQLGNGTTTDSVIPVQATGLTDATNIAAGYQHTMALKKDGTVWGWGHNWDGQLGNHDNGNGSDRYTPVQAQIWVVTAIATGDWHTVALKNDGSVWAWGAGANGRLGNNDNGRESWTQQAVGLTNMAAIAAGGAHTAALKNDDTVWTWGYNGYGQLGDGTNSDRWTPVQIADFTGVSYIVTGLDHTVALKSDGTVWTWGRNNYGQLGDGTAIDSNIPIQVAGLAGIAAISGGDFHTVALKKDGTVWAWGRNYSGQLGDGTTIDRTTPVQVINLSGVSAVAAGVDHTVAMKIDGTLRSWGDNWYGQLGDGTTTDSSTPVEISAIQLLPAPTVSTGTASLLTANSATLNGTVNPNGVATTYYFQYGTTTTYGTTTAIQSAGSGANNINVTADLTGLIANTTYHFRLVAKNSAVTTNGSDQTFTTTGPSNINNR